MVVCNDSNVYNVVYVQCCSCSMLFMFNIVYVQCCLCSMLFTKFNVYNCDKIILLKNDIQAISAKPRKIAMCCWLLP